MKHAAFLLTVLASLPLAACSLAPANESDVEGQASSTTDPLRLYIEPDPTVIDFDSDTARAAIADGAVVDTTYTSVGVTLSCVVCGTGHAYARSPGRTGNGVSVSPISALALYDSRLGAVRADFTTPRSWVSIDVLAVLPPEHAGPIIARPWIEAYNAAGQMVGPTVYYPSSGTTGFGLWQTLRIDDPTASIKYVRFSSQYFYTSTPVYGSFDNLTFNTDGYWVDIKTPILPFPTKPFIPHVVP